MVKERKNNVCAFLGYPVSENFVSWCQSLKNSSASFLCIQEHLFHFPWFKNVYIWSAFVLCMMSGQLISDASFPKWTCFFHLGKDARSSGWCVLHTRKWRHPCTLILILEISFRFIISRDSKMCTFEVLLFCVWCLDNWSRILSGKPFNTFSMARLKTLQFHLTLCIAH
jgi:hypothetical protein